MVLRKTYGPNRDRVTGSWRKNVSWFELICMTKCRLRWVGHAAHMGNRGGVNRLLVGKLWVKEPLKILRCRWEDNIKWVLKNYSGIV
jgi:hypothetical protein